MRNLHTVLVVLLVSNSALAQGLDVWVCDDPPNELRYALENEDILQPPPCDPGWIHVYDQSRTAALIFEQFSESNFPASNVFIAEVAELSGTEFPKQNGVGPIRTSEIFESPSSYGFSSIDIENAESGTIVVYDGHAGVLLQVTDEEAGELKPQILYPSASNGFQLIVSDLDKLGAGPPKAIIKN